MVFTWLCATEKYAPAWGGSLVHFSACADAEAAANATMTARLSNTTRALFRMFSSRDFERLRDGGSVRASRLRPLHQVEIQGNQHFIAKRRVCGNSVVLAVDARRRGRAHETYALVVCLDWGGPIDVEHN